MATMAMGMVSMAMTSTIMSIPMLVMLTTSAAAAQVRAMMVTMGDDSIPTTLGSQGTFLPFDFSFAFNEHARALQGAPFPGGNPAPR